MPLGSGPMSLGKSKLLFSQVTRGRILGRHWDKSPKVFPPCSSQSPLLTEFTGLKTEL
jgi:hypothetical protein